VLRHLQYRSAGGNWLTLKKYAYRWDIPTAHFDPDAVRAEALRGATIPRPLEEVLVEGSGYSRRHLKLRLFAEGLKEKFCELCGQGEVWRGRRMALILDHINGVPNDNRLENLRIVCPNCAATFDTHCARKNRQRRVARACRRCGAEFLPRHRTQRYCSRKCGSRYRRTRLSGIPRPETRKVERPPYDQLLRDIEETSYLAVGRKYGVSGNAIRKWVSWYEREAERRRMEGDLANGSQLALPDA
jgi:ribosomal protein S27AE